MSDWFRNMDFWRNLSPILFHQSNWDKSSVEVNQGLTLLQLSQGGTVLDLACGPGRHSIEFARRGFRVTAVDLMPFYLEEGQKRAKAEGLHVEFIQDDMRTFIRPNAFDVVWNFFSSFGYFENQVGNNSVILNAFKSLRKDGKLLIDMNNREFAINFWKQRERFEHPPIEGITLTEEGRFANDGSQIFLRWFLDKDGDIEELNFSLRLYTASEMRSLLMNSGFSSATFYGDISGSQYTSTSERMVVLACK